MSVAESAPLGLLEQCIFRLAVVEDAQQLVSSYESVFGQGGVKAPGHEPYPAPEVFTCDGVKAIIENPYRDFIVAEVGGAIAGAMIVSHNSRYHCEFGCVSVRKQFQGHGISSLLLAHAKVLEQETSLSINTTEIVTHSMLSQSAHRKAGYKNIVGFGFCQYPNVFFFDHPESCLWITSFEGRVVEWLRRSKCAQPRQEQLPKLPSLTDEERKLFNILGDVRNIYVSSRYLNLVSKILSQFQDVFNYRMLTEFDEVSSAADPQWLSAANRRSLTQADSRRLRDADPHKLTVPQTLNAVELVEFPRLKVDLCDDAPYAYLKFPRLHSCSIVKEIEDALKGAAAAGKRYVQARIPANTCSALKHIEHLRERKFVFLGLAPLFSYDEEREEFEDVLLMQWLAPSVMAHNSLPGETDSVVKLHGYPINLTGDMVAMMRQDLSADAMTKNARRR
jgi:GNAT superfamily N-acetyltransferase